MSLTVTPKKYDGAEASAKHVHDILSEFNVDITTGLSKEEVENRQFLYGLNELNAGHDECLLYKFIGQFNDPLILLLLASAIVSMLMGHYDDTISIGVAIFIVVTVAFVQEYRSEKSIEELNKLVPPRCHCVRDGTTQDIFACELVPGDVVVLGMGDRIPADSRLVEAIDLEVDESSLTGETHPVVKHTSKIDDAHAHAIAERVNIVYMGTLVRSGRGKAVVFGTGKNSEFGAVFEVMQEVEDRKTPLQIKMNALGKQLSIFSFSVIGLIVLIGVIQGRNLLDMFQIAVSLAVAAIPEGLPICVTVTLALGVMRMAKRHAILKKLPAVEALGCADIVCVDKTGTITRNEMTASEIYVPFESVVAEVSGIGYSFEGEIMLRGEKVDKVSHPHIFNALLAGSLCSNAEIVNGELMGQPTEGALVVCAQKMGIDESVLRSYQRVNEVPFSSEKKWMAVCVESKSVTNTKLWYLKGMIEAILPRCSYLQDNCNRQKSLTASDKERVNNEANLMASKGLRVIAVCYGSSPDHDMILGGIFGISDPPREGVEAAISKLGLCGVRTVMITGDSFITATAIAQKLGIFHEEHPEALSGSEVDTKNMADLVQHVEKTSVFYRTCPRHKLKIVQAFQMAGHQVAMTGDGVNDAPALKAADIGIAMGISGTDVSREAGDMILVDDNFATIVCAMEEGKSIFYNIKNFLRFQLSTSIAALSLITLSTLFDLPNPLNAMQILWINIIMDGPPAQSLGVEPVDKDIMREPPRHKDTPIITRTLIQRVITSASFIVIGTLFVFYMALSKNEEGEYLVTRRDRTLSFTTFVLFDMFNALCCRSEHKSIWQLGLLTNIPFCIAVSASLIGQLLVIYFPPLQAVFQTEALSTSDLFYIFCIASSVLIVDEIRKIRQQNEIHSITRRFRRKKSKTFSVEYDLVV